VERDAAARAVADLTGRLAQEDIAARRALVTALQVGPLRVMTPHDQVDLARELFESVWREDFFGITESPSLERSVFAFDWWRTQPAEVYVVALAESEDPVVRRIEVARSWVPRRAELRRHVRDAIWAALRDDFPSGSPMRSWLREGAYVPEGDAYRALAIEGTGASRACLAGNVEGCSTALWLLAPPPDRLSEWFTPRQRQNMVRRAAQPWAARADRQDADVRACLDRGETASCDAVLGRIRDTESSLTPPEAVSSIFWYAIGAGDEGAWMRAIENPDASPPEVLERASGRDLETLVEEWRTSLVAHRPSAYAGSGRSAVVVVFWTLILAGFAMRSTRWRFV
jgi:hypothetical protein